MQQTILQTGIDVSQSYAFLLPANQVAANVARRESLRNSMVSQRSRPLTFRIDNVCSDPVRSLSGNLIVINAFVPDLWPKLRFGTFDHQILIHLRYRVPEILCLLTRKKMKDNLKT